MNKARVVVLATSALVAVALAPGCLDATQVTIDVRYARATCAELGSTSVTVGVAPLATEDSVKKGFVNGTTASCDGSGRIGTLVVTPGDGDRASIVVLVASKQTGDPTKCTWPLYEGCIVARRSFAFVEHKGLFLPITVSPECLNVPCDAFSTCRDGRCFPSEVTCSDGTCTEPGALDDGGTVADSGYTPEVNPPPVDGSSDAPTDATDGAADAPSDAPKDATYDGTVDGGGAYCDMNDNLICVPAACGGAMCCLNNTLGPYCMTTCAGGDARLCCTSTDCGGKACSRAIGVNLNLNLKFTQIPVGGSEPGTCAP